MQPTIASNRMESLDVIRGIAVMGIVVMNIQAFAMIPMAYVNPANQMSMEGVHGLVWQISHIFFSTKFITIFTLLFGAGVALFLDKGGENQAKLHRRRMFWLFVIGMIHTYVFWFGDILVTYAVFGFILYFCRNFSNKLFAIVGIFLLLWTFAIGAVGLLASFIPEDQFADFLNDSWLHNTETAQEQIAIYTAPWFERIASSAGFTALMQFGGLLIWGMRTLGLMMFGIILFRTGFFEFKWPVWSYMLFVVLAGGAALMTWRSSQLMIDSDFDYFVGIKENLLLFNTSLFQAVGYMSLIVLLCAMPFLKLLRLPFARAGQMAFTNYLGTTFVCVFLFYGSPGLGWLGQVERLEQLQITLMIWAGMLLLSTIWLSMFRFGPFEWLWRSLTYGKRQPMRRAD